MKYVWFDDLDGLILTGDVLDGLSRLEDNSIEAIVTDPPYDLLQTSRGGSGRSNNPDNPAGRHGTKTGGFMGMAWDATGVAFNPKTWEACLRVLKPGGHLLAFGGTRTHHRMWCAIEDAGFEVRDMVVWLYGQGFPKSHNVAAAIDRKLLNKGPRGHAIATAGTVQVSTGKPLPPGENLPAYEPESKEAKQWEGWGTALKPACEPILLARKPLSEESVAANVLKWGTGALNIDATRLVYDADGRAEQKGRWPANVMLQCTCDDPEPRPETAREREDEPSQERRYTEEGATNIAATPGVRREGGGYAHEPGCPAGLLDEQSGPRGNNWVKNYGNQYAQEGRQYRGGSFGGGGYKGGTTYSDAGGASRFFATMRYSDQELSNTEVGVTASATRFKYCPKASKKEREQGLDNLEIVLLEWESWENEARKAKLLVDTAPSPPKVIAAFGPWDANEWSTMLFGSSTTAPSLQGINPTIETKTSSTTESKTLSWLTHLLTNDFTAGANSEKGSGGSRAGSAAKSNPKLSIIAGKTASLPGVGRVRSGTRLTLNGNAGSPATHPTVKPLALMRYLVRLVTPPDGVVVDPFCGSGSTLVAAAEEGVGFVGIDINPEYCELARHRLEGVGS